MASPQLAIARVSFSAVLLRPDPTSCPRPEIDEFLQLLDATISRCSPSNVQKCKQWILKNLVHSSARIAALGKYLTALANTYSLDVATTRQAHETSTKRKRLHILYILNDVLYQTHVRNRNSSFAEKIEPTIPAFIQATAAFPNSPKHAKKVLDLVNLWDEKGYFPTAFIQKLRTVIREAPDSISKSHAPADSAIATGAKSSKDIPFIMPAMHGDATVSWYDLPAANWLPIIEPNSIRPMNPEMIKPLQFTAGPADKTLIKAVQDLLADVDRIYKKDQDETSPLTTDIDQLGQRVVLDEITGEVLDGETYYGWSRAFCEKMKQRRKKGSGASDDDRGRSVSRSRNSSRGSSRPTYKRRRVSSSRSPSRSRSRSRGNRRRQRSYSSSRSPSRDRRYGRDVSRSPRRSPPARAYGTSNGKQSGFPSQQPPYDPQFQHSNPPPPPFPQSFPPMPPDLSQFIVPPPPPPNYQGQWPPPPPPPPIGGVPPNMPPNWLQDMMKMGGWPANSPPPPPQQQSQPQYGGGFQQQGRGGRGRGDYRGHGNRGGWDHRGRGW